MTIIESPCVLICSIDFRSGYCHGCGRTGDEIAQWTVYSPEQRSEIMETLPGRMNEMERRPRRQTRRRQRAASSSG